VSQVLINLISNAIKFTDKGSITVLANFEASNSTNTGTLTISVRDTGGGMTSEEMERLFQRFAQANARISSGSGGSGLGLSVSKQLALLMQGDLQAESKKGRGSTFTFSLPCERVAAAQQQGALPLPPSPLKSYQQETSRKVNVLIVEDNAINQKLLMNLLARKGYLYEVANNGQEAVEKFSRGHFDLIFMDLQMPIMDGIAATQQIRKLEATTATQRPVPIFALTGNAREARVQEALSAGVNGYLTKPYDWQHIYDVIRQSVFDHE
jgi:CheY-like chemotaxis protein